MRAARRCCSTTPGRRRCFYPALAHGVDLSIQAATKYIGGHADVMMGYVAANESHAARLLEIHGNLRPLCQRRRLFSRACAGLRTLAVRLKRHQETALTLARWLQARPEVSRVLYPALEDDPGHALWKRDFTGACGLFGVVLKPASHNAVARYDRRPRRISASAFPGAALKA